MREQVANALRKLPAIRRVFPERSGCKHHVFMEADRAHGPRHPSKPVKNSAAA